MKNFKPDQKVVFSTEHLTRGMGDIRMIAFKEMNQLWPQEKEVVTIEGPGTRSGWWRVKEYPKTSIGTGQMFSDTILFPLEEISKRETESIISKIEKEQTIEIKEPILS